MDFREVSELPEILCVLGVWGEGGELEERVHGPISSKWSLQQRVNSILKDMTFFKMLFYTEHHCFLINKAKTFF